MNKNLLFVAAVKVKKLKLHKYMWSVMGTFYETHKKFTDLVLKTNEDGYNVLQLAVIHNKLEIIQWIFSKIDREVFNPNELQNFIKSSSTKDDKNILHLAAQHNSDPAVHVWLWETISKRFGRETLKEMVENVDKSDRNVFHLAALHNSNLIFTKLYELAKLHLGSHEMRKLLRKKELIYDENVFDIVKQHARDTTIHTWLKTKRHKYF
ncbi:hypothetical protein PVAND_016576 [Polypedilum vanderplanki]|uniref:Ankyrin repeat protein n=1 Tax=Polypedilum vanderplanki TaxID=319348 RepID=A0A9J6BFH0_POLVA|nr:hypothetical protein PVAND_016576 [Polypedilum vanderplanki]